MKILSAHQLDILMKRLVELTEDGKLTWQSHDDFTFEATVGETSFWIRSIDEDDRHPYSAEVGWNGEPIQKIHSVVHGGSVADMPLNHSLAKVYSRAKRQALDLDSVVGSIFADLGTEIPPEEDPGRVPF